MRIENLSPALPKNLSLALPKGEGEDVNQGDVNQGDGVFDSFFSTQRYGDTEIFRNNNLN